MKTSIRGLLCGLVATCIWGGVYPISRVLFGFESDHFEPLNFTFIRFAMAALFLSPVFFSRDNRRRAVDMVRHDGLSLLLITVIGILCEGLLVFWALNYTTSVRASLMANVSPIWTLLLSWLAGREALTGRNVMGMTIGFAGLVIVFLGNGNDMFTHELSTAAGDIMALGSGLCWAAFTVYGERLSRRYGGILCVEIMFIIATACMFLLSWAANGCVTLSYPPSVWLGAVYLGMLSYGLGNSLWYTALQSVSPGRLGAFGYLSAMISMGSSVLFIQERFSFTFFVAMALVLTGVAMMMKK